MKSSIHPLVALFFLVPFTAHADWQTEIGLTRLQTLNSDELPTNVSAGLTHVEATESGNYAPDTTSSVFSGKTFNLKSGTSSTSSHANTVATNFYGTTSCLPGTSTIDLYTASDWISSGFLNTGTTSTPATETRAVQNHSWIGSSSYDSEILSRLDYAIDRDGFVCVVGVNNGTSTTLPNLLCQAYNTISVGLANGGHSAGLTTLTEADRQKPEIVAPATLTSYATPMVSGAAGLLYSKLTTAYSLTGADRPRVIKALLMASATKNTLSSWSPGSTSPLDAVYGSGELNAYHAYSTLRSGRAAASSSSSTQPRGWAAESVTGNGSNTYYFSIPAGSSETPFSAALVWHRKVTTGNAGSTRTWTPSVNHLNLKLYQASGFTLGSLVKSSKNTVDNVQLIYQSALASGDYALVVESASTTATTYGLAWHSLPTVSVIASSPTASESTGEAGVFTVTRTGDTTLPLYVPLVTGGTAVSGTHYTALPESVTIPADAASITISVVPVADDIPQGDRSVTLAVADDFALVHPATSAEVTIQDRPADAWKFLNFTTEELADSAISGNTADPDHDSLCNLLEYALGLSPKTTSISPVSQSIDSGYLTLAVSKNTDATDLIWSAEVSEDLQNWSAATIITNTDSDFAARDPIATTEASKRFIRLKVTSP
ncbi:MAG: S8 family serine peptidase [Luteolibacter sp.]